MPKVKPLGLFTDQKKVVRKVVENRMNDADILPAAIEKRGIFSISTFYCRIRNPGDFKLSELWKLEAMGVKFSNEDILRMFGRDEKQCAN